MATATLPPHDALNHNLGREHNFEPLRIEGRIPADLQGTLYRTGPGVYERFGRRVAHAFEADGVMSAVRFVDGLAHGATRVVRSAEWHEEERAGKPIYSSAARFPQRLKAIAKGKAKATGNTNMWMYQGQLYALMEAAGPVAIDPVTLATVGETDLGGVIPQAFSAHPHRVAEREASFNFGVRFGRTMEIDLFELPDRGTPRRLTTVTAPYNALIHDFVATRTHLVLLICPAKLRPVRASLGIGSFDTWFNWKPELGTTAIVIPIDNPDAVQTFEIDPFWFWHTGNAWSEGSVLQIDLCRYPNVESLSEIGNDHSKAAPPRLNRLTLDLDRQTSTTTRLHERSFEFPHVHPGVEASRHTVTFGLVEWDVPGHRGVASIGEDGSISEWVPAQSQQASEPIVVPRGPAEDDAWILTLVHDDAKDASHVAVLDGQNLADGPVARAWFDQTLPLTFHGTFKTP